MNTFNGTKYYAIVALLLFSLVVNAALFATVYNSDRMLKEARAQLATGDASVQLGVFTAAGNVAVLINGRHWHVFPKACQKPRLGHQRRT